MRYHHYLFFNVDKSVYAIPETQLTQYKKEFLQALSKQQESIIYTYATLGLKANTIFTLWIQSDSEETIQNFLNNLLHTSLGKYLTISYTLFGMTRPTQYSSNTSGHLETTRKGGQYLIIYPFTKTREWYMLPFEKRKSLMEGHMAIGRKYPQITQLLLYSFGVDDNEFIVSYETDDLPDFQKLVMDLRSDNVRLYTKNDTPIFTCIYKSFEEILDFI